jgi:hypothetical protein
MYMLSISCCELQPNSSFKYIEARTSQGEKRFVFDDNTKVLFLLVEATHNATGPELKIHKITKSDLKNLKITFINKLIQCNPQEMPKEPGLMPAILSQYNHSHSIPGRFRAIMDLNEIEKTQYKQISDLNLTEALRCSLLALVDDDLKAPLSVTLDEWATFGVSASEVDISVYSNFKAFYDEVMDGYGTQKEDYTKLDFATQNIKTRITDPRCLAAKLTPLQIFKAAYQLGDIPAVSNFRFMDNPASKDDGKYREWMFHFDNSNYAAEFKLITTRVTGTCQANTEQCLAAFPYDTSTSIRFTQSEAATKFSAMEDLEQEFRSVPGARYVVIQNPDNQTPLETGIRTEMIVHHRSASSKNEPGQRESRSSELMTFHGQDRCKPFLSEAELTQADHLSPLQHFVLGGFKNTGPEKFLECLATEQKNLNLQIRKLIEEQRIKPLNSLTVATFSEAGTTSINNTLFHKQINTYENLPEVLEKIPSLADESSWQKATLFKMVPMLMNYDQNAELRPDCTENDALPARTQLRERTNQAFFEPLERDLPPMKMGTDQHCLLPLNNIIDVVQAIHGFYSTYTPLLKALQSDSKWLGLFESRAALAKEYTEQFRSRATLPETHQTLCLFTYYMLDDLKSASEAYADSNIKVDNNALETLKKEKTRILQHFITHRILSDRNKN